MKYVCLHLEDWKVILAGESCRSSPSLFPRGSLLVWRRRRGNGKPSPSWQSSRKSKYMLRMGSPTQYLVWWWLCREAWRTHTHTTPGSSSLSIACFICDSAESRLSSKQGWQMFTGFTSSCCLFHDESVCNDTLFFVFILVFPTPLALSLLMITSKSSTQAGGAFWGKCSFLLSLLKKGESSR